MHLRLLLGLFALCIAPACTDRATEGQCDEAFEKFKEIRAQDQPALVKVVTLDAMERERPDFLESCVGIASRENVRCWLGARTEDELKKCQ